MAYQKTLEDIGLTHLTEAEKGLIAAVKACEQFIPEGASQKEPPEKKGGHNTIRAPLIRHLMQGGCDKAPMGDRGLGLLGCWIVGKVDLEIIRSEARLTLFACRIEDGIDLADARLYDLTLMYSNVAFLRAERLALEENLSLSGAVLRDAGQLSGARIGGDLSCTGAKLKDGLTGHGVQIGGSCLLDEEFTAKGLVSFSGSKIDGQLSCINGHFQAGLKVQGLEIGGSCFLSDGFASKGLVDLNGSKIDGQLDCSEGNFEAGLMAHGIEIGGGCFLCGGFASKGPVDLNGSKIGGQLDCSEGNFEAGLMAHGIEIGGGCFLRDGFASKGSVDLNGGKIGGQLSCIKGNFEAGLTGHGLEIGGACFLADGFSAKLRVHLAGSKIGAQLVCWDGSFADAEVRFDNVSVGTDFIWSVFETPDRLGLGGMFCQRLWDRPEDWPKDMVYDLTGFTYGGYGKTTMRLKDRLDWVKRSRVFGTGRFTPKPYTQLASIYTRDGERFQANQALAAREWEIAKTQHKEAHDALNGDWGPALRSFLADAKFVLAGFAHVFFGSGYKPYRGIVAAAVLLVASAVFFNQSFGAGQIVPRSDVILTSWGWGLHGGDVAQWTRTVAGQDYASFRPMLYAFDLMIPLDALGQEAAWNSSLPRGWWGPIGHHIEWLLQLYGWVLTAFLAAFLTGLIGRRDDQE